LLTSSPQLQALTSLEELPRRYPGTSPHRRRWRRGSSDVQRLTAYRDGLDAVGADPNRRHATALEDERPALQALPAPAAATYGAYCVRVTPSSTISVRRGVYSVPSRLIGERLKVPLYEDRPVRLLGATAVLTLPRL